MKRTRLLWKARALYLPYVLLDAIENRRAKAAVRRFLVLRHSGKSPYFHNYFLQWLEKEAPDMRARFELRLLPCRNCDFSRYVLHIPWFQDPAEDWMTRSAFRRAIQIAARCRQMGIPVINPIDRLSNATKSVGARIMAEAGVRTPKIRVIQRPETFRQDLAGLALPLLVRQDRGHGGPTFLVRSRADVDAIPFGRLRNPIAVEFIDGSSPRDGLYRKYRYLAAGEIGVPRHLMISSHWEVREKQRIVNHSTRDEELAYLDGPDPNHARLQAARRAMGLDWVAFDYGYDPEGRLVVWEANPYPSLRYPQGEVLCYSAPFVHRSYAAMAKMYLTRAGLPVPSRLEKLLENVAGYPLGAAAPCREQENKVPARVAA